jgi:hypothetical protein
MAAGDRRSTDNLSGEEQEGRQIKELEILVLRHELARLRPPKVSASHQADRPAFRERGQHARRVVLIGRIESPGRSQDRSLEKSRSGSATWSKVGAIDPKQQVGSPISL